MSENDALDLIRKGVPTKSELSVWADLGSGSGTFTIALAKLLGDRSKIFAVDKDQHIIASPNQQVEIQNLQADFSTLNFPKNLDGILMANSLHYVSDQEHFLQNILTHLKPDGRLMVIEYDTNVANAWVPYPLTFKKLTTLLSRAGYQNAVKIGERDSVYNQNKMYACYALAWANIQLI